MKEGKSMSNQRIAFVTGGMGGIGTAISQRLYKENFTAIVGCTPQSKRKDGWLAAQRDSGFCFEACEHDVTLRLNKAGSPKD
ncbi:hypothetical protein GCM10027514_14830 [Azotobacter armeniacus]